MKLLCFILVFMPFNLHSIEISLEENRAESGTVGYVDIKKIFDKFASASRKNFNDEIKKRQGEVEDLKKELFEIRAKKEKLMWEYEIARMYEEFKTKISSFSISESSKTIVDNVNETSTTFKSDYGISMSSSDVAIDSNTAVAFEVSTSSSTTQEEEPFVVMPGVGMIPISMFKFSVSSSTLIIDAEIKFLEKKSDEIEKKIYELKERYDAEISEIARKENIEVFKKIYQAIEEVAKKEGISIVVDKRNILFGMKSIDLTDRVIEKMEQE